MRHRKFYRTDMEQVNEWYAYRQKPVFPHSMVPGTGFIVDGVCAGFLYRSDSGMCWLDSFISNPLVPAAERAKALDAVTDALIQCAIDDGFSMIVAMTKSEAIRVRCKRYGFKGMGNFDMFVRGQ